MKRSFNATGLCRPYGYSSYMDKLGQKQGYLILFEKQSSEELPWEARIRREVHEVDGKDVILLGM